MLNPAMILRSASRRRAAGKTAMIVGVGNIGSNLAPMIARRPDVATVLLVDSQVYDEGNIAGQGIFASDIGKPKALAVARRLRRIDPALEARAFCAQVEDLPLGLLWCDAIFSCVDSRSARRSLNQAAWRLGVPLIDAAVDGPGLLARVSVHVPGPESCCLECSWDPQDYESAALEQRYTCQGGGLDVAATNAPASLGAIAAGMMAIEFQKLLVGDREQLLAGRQSMLDLRHHTQYTTSFRSDHCRFDHRIWSLETIERSPARITLGLLLRRAGGDPARTVGLAAAVEGRQFVNTMFCQQCRRIQSIRLCLAGRIADQRRRCPACGLPMVVRGFDRREWIDASSFSRENLARPLADLGVVAGDVLSVRGEGEERHFLLAGARRRRSPAAPSPADFDGRSETEESHV